MTFLEGKFLEIIIRCTHKLLNVASGCCRATVSHAVFVFFPFSAQKSKRLASDGVTHSVCPVLSHLPFCLDDSGQSETILSTDDGRSCWIYSSVRPIAGRWRVVQKPHQRFVQRKVSLMSVIQVHESKGVRYRLTLDSVFSEMGMQLAEHIPVYGTTRTLCGWLRAQRGYAS